MKAEMKVAQLVPGIMLEPKCGFAWYEVPWRGYDGKITGTYLTVAREGAPPGYGESRGRVPVIYVGKYERNADKDSKTPGRQRVLAWGEVLNVDPASWRKIKPLD